MHILADTIAISINLGIYPGALVVFWLAHWLRFHNNHNTGYHSQDSSQATGYMAIEPILCKYM